MSSSSFFAGARFMICLYSGVIFGGSSPPVDDDDDPGVLIVLLSSDNRVSGLH